MNQAIAKKELIVYSDYVCPFCYIGKAALERYLQSTEHSPVVTWQPFDLRGRKRREDGSIDQTVPDGKDASYFAQVRENVERLKEKYNLDMSLDVAREVDSWNAQKVALHVKSHCDPEIFHAFHEALFATLWKEGKDIGDADVLAEVAEKAGVRSSAEVRNIADSEVLDRELKRQFAKARAAGVRAVPTFAFEEHAVRGAAPPAQLKRLVEGE